MSCHLLSSSYLDCAAQCSVAQRLSLSIVLLADSAMSAKRAVAVGDSQQAVKKAKTLLAEAVKDAEAEEEDIDEEEDVEGEVDGEDEEDYDGEEGVRY